MPIYNKLVRDKIPEIIGDSGRAYNIRTLIEAEYVKELKLKLGEEVEEYLRATQDRQSLEELADIIEIIHSLVKVHGETIFQVEEIRKEKVMERGGFSDWIFLVDVED
ncbi:nucleoside triphosphate pyrophosphohydrolase [Alkalihalobacterium alkalinitrilicum]|uniref:nucleoside triphosphate pyrophosphohydrolase n=1 Tax=Alkalihalobacterium alkalinitrilicum TaxID=427920 RepID=UPI000995B20E|nr:nucleoside triphosphate pyrophosphohydrolase [Alkalihalobacterium alkalinitrilicum]